MGSFSGSVALPTKGMIVSNSVWVLVENGEVTGGLLVMKPKLLLRRVWSAELMIPSRLRSRLIV